MKSRNQGLLTFSFLSFFSFHAFSAVPGNYPVGSFTGMRAAMPFPQDSFVIENGTLFYNSNKFVDDNGNTTSSTPINAFVNRTLIGYNFGDDVFGGTYTIAAIFPFANAKLRPDPEDTKSSMQLGDIVLQPLGITWSNNNLSYGIAYNLWIPTGRFNAGSSNNVGKGLYSHLFTGSIGWKEDSDFPWLLSIQLKYEYLEKQKDTNIEPGDNLIIEGGLGKEVISGFDVGISYYLSHQLSSEKGSNDKNKSQVYGIGPELNWRPESFTGLQVSYRGYVDFEARNTSQGFFNVISIAYLF